MTLPAKSHPDEPGAVAMLDQAITALTNALDDMPINEVANLKAKIATIAAATKQLGMSKEAQEYATEAVRRSEWALGRAIRRGQAEGTVARRGYVAPEQRNGGEAAITQVPDLVGKNEWRGPDGIAAVTDAAPTAAEFDEVIDEARAEGNLSRANVARKAREKSAPEAPKQQESSQPRRRPLPDAFWQTAYDLGKKVESLHRLTQDDRWSQNAEKVAASHRNDLLRINDLLSQVISSFPEKEASS